jgi:putative thioredoxin
VVRAVQDPAADHREGGQGGQGRGQAGQDQHRPEPDAGAAATHPVDPCGLRLLRRPPRGWLHGRGARESGQAVRRPPGAGAGGAPGEGGGDELAELLEHAKAAIAQNDQDLAARIYSEILGADPKNVTALAGLARYNLQTGDAEQAKELLAQVEAKDKTNADVVAVQASLDLAEKAKEAGPVDDLKAKAAADPKDMQSRLDLAMAYWAGNQRKEAIDELLVMIKADRKWNEEAARQQLLKFFEALGFTDPLAVDGRKRLSTILFS